jgi:glycosyltransferase involved in cell wall biosynthesis
VGLWGHIKDYVNPTHPLDAALERWQLRHADHIFAYTPGGAAYAKDLGVRDGKITTVMNSIDTLSLSRTWKAVSPERLDAYRLSHGLRPGRTLAYIGGIDGSKRIEFLVAALDQLFESDPDVRVLIGGRGSQEALLNRAFRRGQAVLLGHVDVQERALIGRAASAMLMPGRIGLVAVDCLVMRLPILTTDWPYHAPEAEYLTEGVSKITLASDPEGYARGIGEYLRRSPRPDVSSTHWRAPSLQQMVSNYREGIKALLGEGR